jgi:translation initiation factor eIF-2B subunit epsilon
VHGVLTSDLLMKNIYTYVAKDGYAARVQDTKSYDAIRFIDFPVPLLSRLMFSLSKDILSRWTFPSRP